MDLELMVTERRIGGVAVLEVEGEIDVATAPQFGDRLRALESDGTATVVVDLSKVSFLDSTALGVLVASFKRLREGGGTLRIVATEPRILRVFEITDLDRVLSIYPTPEAAAAG
jgi:anti-sigma B factor antagonist